ncbi:AAA family ATPase, partial [Geminisphaera colitermitum]|uniref:AAA family ATPase n=1 Tax=Geminisphaera colitermitum TaxID=1148786 RepID=UPI000694BB1A
MHLKALKLHGFKSFADQSTLRFEPGVTAIVGPNGCGKSNVADAIRWVLGEQSAKALRGGKMQDVIFEGADTRKPAQMCEVSLILTDCEKQLGSEFHEIEIMRRVYRDGGGEYFFNGQPCRLKDIQKLFMDTGIGRTSYSIMAQGQIDQILSSKPEERRAVFEEAAGITKYKAQRKEALQKLAQTDQNLVRVADVVGEVGRQIGSLKRQASKALRYKKLSWRLRHLALAHHGYHHEQVSATLATLEEQVIKLRAAAETRRTHLQQQQSALEEQKNTRTRLNQRVQEAQQAVFDLRSQREQAENAANLAQIKRTGLMERLESSRQNLNELDMQLRELASQVDTGAQDKQLQLTLLGSSDAVFQDRNRELGVVEAELQKFEQDLQQSKFQLLQFESNVARLRTDATSYEVDQKTSAQRHDALSADTEAVRQQQSLAAQAVSDAALRAEEATVARARAQQESQDAQTALTALTTEFRDAQKKLQEIDRQLAQRTARLKLLQQLQEKWEGFGEGAKAVLQGRLAPVVGDTRVTPISHGLEIRPEHAKAIEALLGTAVEAIHVADLATAQRILAQLETEQIGAAVLQIPTPVSGEHPTSNIQHPTSNEQTTPLGAAAPGTAGILPATSGAGVPPASASIPLPPPQAPTNPNFDVGRSMLDVGRSGRRAGPPPPPPPSFLHPATTALIGHDPAAAAHPAAALLDSCYLADDLHTFLDYWQTTPDFPFLAIATRKGEIVDRRGLVTGGYSKKPGNSIVQREIDLRETARLLAEDQKQHDDQRAHIDAINARLTDAEATIEQKRHEVLEASQTHATAQAEQRTAERALEEILTRLNRMENELQAVEAARHETQARFERARQGLIEGEQAVEAGRVRIHEMETRITELRTDRDVKRETLGQARLELAERRQKVEVLDRGLSDMERRRAQLTEIVIQRQQEIETWTDQITQLETETDAQRARVAQLAETLLVSQQQVEQIRNELTDIERAINAVENSQEGIRTDAEKSIGELNRCEIELSQNKSRAQFIEEDVQREYQIRVGTYDWRAMIYRHDDDPPDLKTLDLDDEEDDDQPETTDTNNGLNSGAGVPPASEIASAADVPPASDES